VDADETVRDVGVDVDRSSHPLPQLQLVDAAGLYVPLRFDG
jgi:hypothetical protein